MADTISSKERSKNMAAIKSRDTKPEIYFRKALFARGVRYRKNDSKIFGNPDLFIAGKRTAVFINGCFWHRHENCRFAYTPKSHIEFWNRKFKNNIQRDACVRETLRSQNRKCLVVWECTIRQMSRDQEIENTVLHSVMDFLESEQLYLEL